MRRTVLSSILALLASTAACGSGSSPDPLAQDPVGSKEDSLFPNGTDKLGYIKIIPADGSALGLSPVDGTDYLIDSALVANPASPVRVVDGVRRVQLRNLAFNIGQPYSLTEVVVEKTKTTHLLLAGLHVDGYVDYQTTLGPPLQWYVPEEQLGHGGAIAAATAPGRFLQVAPDPFSIELRGDKVIKTVPVAPKGGEIAQPNVALPDPRVTFVVSKPDRTLPSVFEAQVALYATPLTLAQLFPSSNASHNSAITKLSQSGSFRQAQEGDSFRAIASEHTDYHYYFTVASMVVELAGPSGATIEAPLRRLDVHDVEVELETGSTAIYKGHWWLERQIPTASAPAYNALTGYANLPTGTGADVVPGKYRVTVAYDRQEQPSPEVKVYEIEIK